MYMHLLAISTSGMHYSKCIFHGHSNVERKISAQRSSEKRSQSVLTIIPFAVRKDKSLLSKKNTCHVCSLLQLDKVRPIY